MFKCAKVYRAKRRYAITPLGSVKVFILVCGILLFGYAFAIGVTRTDETPNEWESSPSAEPQDVDYSHFTHSNQAHARLPCLICHRRDDNSPRVRFPGKAGHTPCAGCHTVEFSGNTSPMCTICHTDTGMKRFPGLRSFGARFDHAKHPKVNCAVCHKSQGQGVARSIPSGAAAHVTCFQCHSANASNAMASCNICHTPGRLVRTPEWAASFRKGFSHAEHSSKDGLNCAACHKVSVGAARGKQVSSPLPAIHFTTERSLSCAGCHNGKRAFGADNFANCKTCHGTKTFKF